MTIWLASGNDHKKREIEEIFQNTAPGRKIIIRVPGDRDIGFAPREDGLTFLENALIKARALRTILDARGIADPVLADDSGLCVDALDGGPGVHSARYGSEGGENLSAPERNTLLLAAFRAREGQAGRPLPRNVRFVCAMCLLFGGAGGERFRAAQETLEGELLRDGGTLTDGAPGRGQGGFGYDPIVFLPASGKTVAELSGDEKNRLSHRGRAGRALAALLFGERGA